MFDLTAAMVLDDWLGKPFKDIALFSSDDADAAQGAGVLDNFLQLCSTRMNDVKGRAGEQIMLNLQRHVNILSILSSFVSNALRYENVEEGPPYSVLIACFPHIPAVDSDQGWHSFETH
jgi:hypothetical protein